MTRPRPQAAALPLAALAAVVVAGCGSQRHHPAPAIPNRLQAAKQPAPPKARGARLRILAPRPGASVGRSFAALVTVSGFRLRRPHPGQKPLAGQGYLEFSLDHGRYDQPQYTGQAGGFAFRLAVNGYYTPGWTPKLNYWRIPPGRHALTVTLANRDGTPAGLTRTITFAVR